MLGKGMDDNAWKQEVFYMVEMAIPAVIASNNTEKVCNFIFKKWYLFQKYCIVKAFTNKVELKKCPSRDIRKKG